MSHPHGRFSIGVELSDAEVAAQLGRRLGELPEQLDESPAAYVVLGADRARSGASSASPTIVGTVLARRTRRVGLVVGSSPQRDHPYNAGRRAATLDHISGGRTGVLHLPTDQALALGIGAASTWAAGEVSDAARADAAAATRALWRTWPVESLDADRERALATTIRYADHVGTFSTRGPLNVPTTPQGEPVVFWQTRDVTADAVLHEITVAAEVADVVLVDAASLRGLDHERLEAALGGAQLHARVTAVPDATAVIASLREVPGVTGVTLRLALADLPSVLAELPGAAPSTTTLRDRLGVPRRAEPDLSTHAIAFPVASKESA